MSLDTPWICPPCRGRLVPGPSRWECRGCGRAFDDWRGIPDLRTRQDGYLDNDRDRAYAAVLLADFDRLDFPAFLARYFELSPELPDDLKRRQIEHLRTAPGRTRRWIAAMREADPPWLDLGCGSGSFLEVAGRTIPGMMGVDIALRWLLVARKRLDEAGLPELPLACACAEDLPIADAALGGVVAGDVIEHVSDQAATLAEAHRTLREGGRLFLASPNRFSLAPEPHVQVWGVGYLPRRWMAPYVRWRRNVDFRAIRTLGYAEWRRLLRQSPFRGGEVMVPPLPPDDLDGFGFLKRGIAKTHNGFVGARPGQWVGRRIGPLFHVHCQKSVARTPNGTSPATRRRSTPSIEPG
ncbi:MAG: class I SAM-dependent methyltransferase [Isosphaeraceae bacterium]